jgi:undecaprenyl-diphosphatase
VSFIGSAGFVIPVLALVVILLLRRRRVFEAFYLSSVYATSGALNFLLKQAFHRGRPQLPWASGPQDFSFPSGHSMNSTAFYIGLALVVWLVLGRRAGLIALVGGVVMVLLVGLSRVYLGFHYVSDVLGGYSAGLLWVIVWAVASRAAWNRVINRQRHTVGATPG